MMLPSLMIAAGIRLFFVGGCSVGLEEDAAGAESGCDSESLPECLE